VAHEFGHYVEAERRDRTFPYLFSDLLAAEGEGPGASGERESILREQFADLFAVYALGPAYACTCILLEFDPRKADVDPSRHPSDARRVHFLLQALERMQESDRTRPYGWIIGRLTDLWLAGIRAVGKPESLTGEQVRQLDYRLNAMYEILDNPAHQLAGARYELQRWSRVQSLRDALTALASNVAYAAEPEIERRVENVLRGQPYPVILPDVFNAAWLCRLQKEQLQPDVISQCALLMCRKILGQ
jgi:hypothetical protein